MVYSDLPEAFVAVGKNRQKVYTDEKNTSIVFLENKNEFQLEFFNPLQNSILAQISLNGKPISSNGLVIKPGERIWLDRYLDENKKFLFETYKVDNSEPAKKAIEKNGLLEITFFEEINIVPISSTFTYTSYTDPSLDFYCTCDASDTLDLKMERSVEPTRSKNLKRSKGIETGRVGKGDVSEQKFEFINMQFNPYALTTISYKLLPASQKTIIFKEDLRKYCTACGIRIKKDKWKFCPSCGEKL